MIMHTKVFGEGDPIVFLHTGLQTGMMDFEYQREYFKDNYKVILPDLRGHGRSETDDLSNYFEASVNDMGETLNHLEVESAHIVGCSLGALVGLSFAKKEPQKVRSLTISGIMSKEPNRWSEMHKEDIKHQNQTLQNPDVANYFEKLHKSNWRKLLKETQNVNWYPFELTKDLKGITSPILYMVGEGKKSETKGALLYPAMHKNVHVCIIPFASHLVHHEQPELYTQVLEKFLQQVNH